MAVRLSALLASRRSLLGKLLVLISVRLEGLAKLKNPMI
jgi:hypothetical protein